MTVSHLECQSLSKNIKKCLFFLDPHLLYSPPPKSLDYKIFINKNNKIILINVTLLMKKIQNSSINSRKIGFLYYQNFMPSCRTYFILFMIKIWINLKKYWYSCWFHPIKLCSGTMFLKCVPRHLRTCLNHPNHKQSQPFQS